MEISETLHWILFFGDEMFKKNEDIFTFSVQFENDVLFTEMKIIRTHLIHMFTTNMELVTNLIKRQPIDYSSHASALNNAGAFFNLSTISKSIGSFTDEELYKLASTFHTSVSSSKFSMLTGKINDPIQTLLHFTKYMYVPSRLDFSSIPASMQLIFLKQWLSTVCILVSVSQYTDKFMSIVPVLEIYKGCLTQFLDKEKGLEMCQKIKTIGISSIDDMLLSKLNEKNRLLVFIQTLNKLVFNINIEIVQKFCPNYNVVKGINPGCDGAWVSPFDEDVNIQIKKLQDIAS